MYQCTPYITYILGYISPPTFSPDVNMDANTRALAHVWLMPVITFRGMIVELDMIIITALSLNCHLLSAILR